MNSNLINRRKLLKTLTLGAVVGSAYIGCPPSLIRAATGKLNSVPSKVKSIEVTLEKRTPNPEPIRDAFQSLPGVGSVHVKIISDDGFIGKGEVQYGRIPGALETLKAVIDNELSPIVIGTKLSQIRSSYKNLVYQTDYHGTSGLATFGISALDTALWDCLGKTLEVPCWHLWGGCHDEIPTYAMLGWISYDNKQLQKKCEQSISQGYRAVKLKVGFPTLKEDIARIKFVRSIIGDDILMMVDANQVLTIGDAIMRGKAFEDLGCYWFEEPIPAHDLEGYKHIARELTIQLAAGENLFSPFDFARFLKNDAVDIVQPDIRRCGGPTALLEIGLMAHAFNIPYASHGAGAAHMNVMACLPNVIYVETTGTDNLHNGMIKIPQGPGLCWE